MPTKKTVNITLNRVEGDLKLNVEIIDNIVHDSYSSGTMYRGFERMMIGRDPLDSLAITPRICGICTSAHLNAAAMALDMICDTEPPPNAQHIRNLTLITEHLQSDMRHAFLMFMVDFTNKKYTDHSFYNEAVQRYQPLKGSTTLATIKQTRKLLEIISIVGGQWPHSAHIVPGGISSLPSHSDILQCKSILAAYKRWYEKQVIGCTLEKFHQVQSLKDLESWLSEKAQHEMSELGLYIKIARQAGLDIIGQGPENFICAGTSDTNHNQTNESLWSAPGFLTKGIITALDQNNISEHVTHSMFKNYPGGKHPFAGETNPLENGVDNKKYSWCKAPRYNHLPAETGPLAEMLVSGNPLLTDIYRKQGANAFIRQFARLIRPTILIPHAEKLLNAINYKEPFYKYSGKLEQGEGFGLVSASRGILGHWVKIKNNKISHYQIITPTSWNASPRDDNGTRGPWEEALIGTKISDPNNPVELGHIIRSFDACLVCSVHTINKSADALHSSLINKEIFLSC